MPEVKQIDWSKFPQTKSTRGQPSAKAIRKAERRRKKALLKKQVTVKDNKVKTSYVFNPVLPNRDRYKLQHELSVLNIEIRQLKERQAKIVADIKEIKAREREHKIQPVSLYALELEDGCYYIGMTFNVEYRFKQHYRGKGAAWTKKHTPVRILETRTTEFYDQDEVARLEDDMTIEYAMKYGSDKVRGGGYCQSKPHWPAVVIENEIPVI